MKKKHRIIIPFLKHLISRQFLLIGCVGIIYIGIAYIPFFTNFSVAPKDRYYYGGDDYAIDMLGNLTIVRQGYMGSLLRLPQITTMIEGGGYLLKTEYILIGHLARFFSMNPITMFHIVRFFLTLLYMYTILLIIISIFKNKKLRMLAFMIILFCPPIFLNKTTELLFKTFPNDALIFQRLTLSAHHYMIGGIFSLLTIFFFSRVIEHKDSLKSFFFAIISGVITSMTYSPNTILIFLSSLGAIPLIMAQQFVQQSSLQFRYLATITALILGISIIPMFYMKYLSMNIWDFTTHPILERLNPFTITPFQYILFGGVPLIFSLISFPMLWKKQKPLLYFFYFWIFAHIITEFFLSSRLGLNKIRVFLTPTFVIWGTLMTVTLSSILNTAKKLPYRHTPQVILAIIIVVTIALGWKSYAYSFSQGYVTFITFPDFSYPQIDVVRAIQWLEKNSQKNHAVLSGHINGNIIPAFSGNDVYTSWWHRLTNLESSQEASRNLELFFQGKYPLDQIKPFFIKNRIHYVFFSDEEKKIADGLIDEKLLELSYPFSKNAHKTPTATLYKVDYLLLP